VSRKVSVDSVGDTSADDLLRFLYDLIFRQPSVWGWLAAGVFAAVPAWLALVCFLEGNLVGGVVFVAMAGVLPGLRYYLLHRMGAITFPKRQRPANDG
jgi:hypothetical protein